ncbi:MAG: isoprenylcysteine carboxylmethyltransferase family protein [Alphaproteobacteria bacterium]|nr:MAG: isoprenylcysteine carboxylmethyltransferase family protein [Alphaproteobacteria bacterium]
MSKAASLLFALIAYAVFFATFLYLIAFVGNLPWVPLTVDRGPSAAMGLALLVDAALIALFGVQHSVMARQGFKRAWKRVVPDAAERSFYVLAASAALILLFLFWRPIEGTLWTVGGAAAWVLWGLFALGWGIVLLSTFLINHFELFGLQQAWFHARGREAAPPVFRQPFLYKQVRHPLYAGFFLAFWATPQMSYGHLFLALGMSAYMLIAIVHEERDLVGLFGKDYEDYRERVGMLMPRFRGRTPS